MNNNWIIGLLEEAVEEVKAWPEEMQRKAVRVGVSATRGAEMSKKTEMLKILTGILCDSDITITDLKISCEGEYGDLKFILSNGETVTIMLDTTNMVSFTHLSPPKIYLSDRNDFIY